MKERPILMSSPMIRALLAGTKTQTRRVVKEPGWATPNTLHLFNGQPWASDPFKGDRDLPCPYGQPGDRLLVASEIPGVGRTYCAGADGAIYSRARGAWRPLKAHLNDNGYPCVTVMLESRKTTRAVHSLVCAAFYGPPPFDGAQVRHLDGDRQHSRPENLCWGTQAENWQDRRTHGNGIEGEKHHAAKLTNDERAHLRWAIERGLCSQRHAARVLGMTQSAVGQVIEAAELRVTEPRDAGLRIPRITLEITAVRVERLQGISEVDVVAEGCAADQRLRGDDDMAVQDAMLRMERDTSRVRVDYAIARYMVLWEQINGPGSWVANPWVWCVEFKRATPNAEAVRPAVGGSERAQG